MAYKLRATEKSLVDTVETHLRGVQDVEVLHRGIETFSPVSQKNGKFVQTVDFIVVPKEPGEYSEEALSSMVRSLIPNGLFPIYSIDRFHDLRSGGKEITVRILSLEEVLGKVDSVKIVSGDCLLIEQYRRRFSAADDGIGNMVVSLGEEVMRGIQINLFPDLKSADEFWRDSRLRV